MSVGEHAVSPVFGEVVSGVGIAPSILSADYARLGEQVLDVLEAGARVIHCDVMDGLFVPAITFGTVVVGALRDLVHDAGGMLDVHLMIERPERQIEQFVGAGADLITIHVEATAHAHHALGEIRRAGCLAGIALNPGTPIEAVASVVELADVVLCMTVNPGWGGQRFIDSMLEKLARLRELAPDSCAIEVDGGIDARTAPLCAERGANLLVAGSAVFGAPEPGEAYRTLGSEISMQ